MKKLSAFLIVLLVSIKTLCQTSSLSDTAFYTNGDTVIHTITNSTAVFTYPVTTVTITIKQKVTSPPPNQSPVASAGASQSITLPVNTIVLSGTATDPDGTIASVLWSQSSGPILATIVSPASPTTSVTGLTAGVYVFKFQAFDNKGAAASSVTNITVNLQVIQPTGLQGFGSNVTGGDAYKESAYHVTNLKASGAGSLADGIRSNRYIVFDVSGIISGFRFDVGNNVSGNFSNITIDGYSAPSPGITLDNAGAGGNTLGFEASGSNIVNNIKIIGIRAINAGGDNFHFLKATNIALINCSAWGAGDGNCDITNGSRDITVQDCIFGPGCQCNANGTDRWAGNMLIAYGTGRISVHHNIFYPRTPKGVAERNPDVSNQNGAIPSPVACDFVSNVVYNWGRQKPDGKMGSGYGTCFDYGSYGNVRNNYYYTDCSACSPENAVTESAYGETRGTIYAIGNISGNTGVDPNNKTAKVPYGIDPAFQVAEQDACSSLKYVLSTAGVRYNGVLVNSEEQRIVNIIKASHPNCNF